MKGMRLEGHREGRMKTPIGSAAVRRSASHTSRGRMSRTIVVIDDELSVREVVRAYLERDGHVVHTAATGDEGLALAERVRPALIVLDLMLPDLSGEEICRRIRSRSDTPIVLLTAKAEEEQRLTGFTLGADDYVTKPFSPRELTARVRAVLRRAGESHTPLVDALAFEEGTLRIDTVHHEVTLRGEAIELTASEYRLLVALASYPGRVYSRSELLTRVQGHEAGALERTIDVHIKNLRRKIEPDPRSPRYVQTVKGSGYRFARR